MKPELRQMSDLTAADFERAPVWVQCHFADHDEPWYDETDECTVRPWSGTLPVPASAGIYLARATATLADGSRVAACMAPSGEPEARRTQPVAFVGGATCLFWGGAMGIPPEERQQLYHAVGKPPAAVFPITFSVAAELVVGQADVRVDGFYRIEGKDRVVIER